MKPARLVGVVFGVLFILLLAFMYTQGGYLHFLIPEPAFGAVGTIQIAGSYATFSGSLKATKYFDNDNPTYFIDPNASSGNSIVVAGNISAPTFGGAFTGNATTATNVAWTGVTDRPGWLSGGSYIENASDANAWRNSGFYENGGGGSNWPSATWYNSLNVRHSNQGNYHGFMIAMSYYDNNLWFRSYQGAGTFQPWVYAISSGNIASQSVSYAATATTATNFNNGSSYSSGGIVYAPTSFRTSDGGTIQNGNQLYCNNGSGCYFNNSGSGVTYVGNNAGTTIIGTATGTFSGNLSGNASTATLASTATIYTGRTDGTYYQAMWTTSGGTSLYSTANVTILSSYPGAIKFRGAYTLEGNDSYGLYSNTGFYAAGGLWDAGNRVYSAGNPQVDISGNANTVDSWHRDDLRTYSNLLGTPTSLPANGGNSDTVDGQNFSLTNPSDSPYWVWGLDSAGSSYLARRANLSVNYATYAQYAQGDYLYFPSGGHIMSSAGTYVSYGVASGWMSASQDGNVGGSSGWNIWSDQRLKKNIVTIDSSLSIIKQLRGVRFNWNGIGDIKDTTSLQSGFIAQEVEKVLPSLVGEMKGYKSVKTGDIIPFLVEGMKEQQTQIESIQEKNNKIDELSAKLDSQQKQIEDLKKSIEELKK